MTPESFKQFLQANHLNPNKILGQNFLMNDIALQDMADSIAVKSGEAVLEIGPGIGNLTARLIEKKMFVLSVEKDRQFEPLLYKLKRVHKNFQFVVADILRFNFSDVLTDFKNYHVVANIPYYITGKIIQMLVSAPKQPKTMTLLVQKEVAENIVATPGRLNLLAISVQLHADAKILFTVPARDFYPAPKVDSAVVQIVFHPKPKYQIDDEKSFFRLLRACFVGKRKQIHNTLASNLKTDKQKVLDALTASKINHQARPQELSIEQWIELYERFR